GAVYVYEREADGWAQRTVLREPSGGRFGAALLLRGDRLFVGNPGDSTGARGAGSTFVYERAAGGWTRKHTLRAARPVAGEWLGSALALAGDTLLNGATGPAPQGSGRVLVFREVDDDWREQQTLTPEPAELGSFFGTSIAVHGDDLVVGAFNGTVGLTGGLAYVYQRDGSGTFVQRAVLRPSNTRAGDFFASGIALAGTTLAIGASQESSAAGGIGTPATGALDRSGALYLFDGAGGAYRQSLQIKSEAPRVLEEFGRNVVVSGDAMFVSASADPDRDGKSGDSGAVYVFR
ncbi:MAG TPA: hypothetical protein VJR89_18105, partial [Polyangiales bacterium]|nr:hypothetical protein [Polyangiales bacterium]